DDQDLRPGPFGALRDGELFSREGIVDLRGGVLRQVHIPFAGGPDLGGEEISDQSQFTTELGSLKFSVAENASNSDATLYATLELNISLLPELKTIKFVPSAVVPYAENKFRGTPYYQIGDIILRKKDSSYWMCVRPSGGPALKDYSYWICLNPSVDNVIKTEKKSYTANGKKHTGIFAKKLMSEKIAKATIHTLNVICTDWSGLAINYNSDQSSDLQINLRKLSVWYDMTTGKLRDGHPFSIEGEFFAEDRSAASFSVAYGSSKKDSKRKTSGSSKNSEFNIVQPIMTCNVLLYKNKYFGEGIYQHTIVDDKTDTLLSLTDSYDQTYFKAKFTDRKCILIDKDYNVTDYYQDYNSSSEIGWLDDCTRFPTELKNDKYIGGEHVIISPELKLKDNGSKLPEKNYEQVYHSTKEINYWGSYGNTVRWVDEKRIDNVVADANK
ncbi:MAG: hypothetical protein K5873_08935, partial [Treponema sp.]|nr:hypothetical protein [Treponema sp.]